MDGHFLILFIEFLHFLNYTQLIQEASCKVLNQWAKRNPLLKFLKNITYNKNKAFL